MILDADADGKTVTVTDELLAEAARAAASGKQAVSEVLNSRSQSPVAMSPVKKMKRSRDTEDDHGAF